MTCTNREKETDWDTFFFEKKTEKLKNYHPPKNKYFKKIKKMPCYQDTGLGRPVALLAGFSSKTAPPHTHKVVDGYLVDR